MFYGESLCQNTYSSGKKKGKRCTNYAYYEKDSKYLCGVHSRAHLSFTRTIWKSIGVLV